MFKGNLFYYFITALFLHHLDASNHNEMKPLLNTHSHNVYSQSGEDGIIEKIFQIIGIKSKNCIECGAHEAGAVKNT